MDKYHNQPEMSGLSSEERVTVENGRAAMQVLQKTFDTWVTVLRAIRVLREKADLDGRRHVFYRLMEQNGFACDPKDKDRVLDSGAVSKGLQILDNLPAVVAWYETLTRKQKREWAAPSTIFKHCPVFKPEPKDPKDKPISAIEQVRTELAKALEENHRLKAEVEKGGGDLWSPSDTADDIAKVMVSKLTPSKAKSVAAAITKLLKKEEAAV